jgi:uncharacterized protein (UPF0276 family)
VQDQGLGVGIMWWPEVDELCNSARGLVDVIEIEPESFWSWNADGEGFRACPRGILEHLSQPRLLHGVGAPLGGTCLPPTGHLETFARDVEALQPTYFSEHLSVNRFRLTPEGPEVFAGFLLPPLQGKSSVSMAASNIRARREAFGGVPIAFETPVSYLPPAPDEWPDGDFIAAVAQEADCGIVLDLHNVLCNSSNGRQGVAAFCDSLPLERIWEVHLAGGEYEGDFYLDAHSGVASEELMEFTTSFVKRLPQLRAITLEIMPDRVAKAGLDAITGQLEKMRDIWNGRGTQRNPGITDPAPLPLSEPPVSPEIWETMLGAALNNLTEPVLIDQMAAWRNSAAPALELYRKLVGEARASALVLAAPRSIRLLLRAYGRQGTRQILAGFWRESPPGYMTADEGRAFLHYLSRDELRAPGLAEAVATDRTQLTNM